MNDGFTMLLRGAMKARGATATRLARAVDGDPGTEETLLAWIEGEALPRPEDREVVAAVEEHLELPRGFLASRLPGEREEWRRTGLYDQSSVAEDDERPLVEAAVAQLGMSYTDFTWTSVHDRIRIDAEYTEAEHEVRLLLTAVRDGVDRYPVWIQTTDADSYPVVTAVTGCRVGRVLEFREMAGVAVQMLLPRPLRAGETVSVEHRQFFVGPSTPRDQLTRGVVSSAREVVMEVEFDPAALPTRVTAAVTIDGQRSESDVEPRATVQLHVVDTLPGEFQIEWVV